MKLLLFLAGVALASSAQTYSLDHADEYFKQFVTTYNKQYANDGEKVKRLEIFKKNLQEINSKNSNNENGVHGITMFSDLTAEEFIAKHTGVKQDNSSDRKEPDCSSGSVNSTSAPESWDWKKKGMVTKIKNQKTCGSCWAFSAIATVEAQYAIKHKKMVDLSEQQLIDCDKRSMGCSGTANIQNPFLYLKECSGSMPEKDYSYQDKQGKCQFVASKVEVKVDGCVTYKPKSEDELKNVLYSDGPVTIAVDASAMQFYTGGVLAICPSIALNHAVTIVGYGTEGGTPFWLIKNSWGESYGEHGYIKIKRGVNACGLMDGIVVRALVK